MFSSKPTATPLRPRSRKRLILITSAIVLCVIAVALGVGLGVGLTRSSCDAECNAAATSSPITTFSPLPSPTTQPSWTPAAGATWQIVLQNPLNLSSSATSVTPNVTVFDIDLFTNSAETIDTLHRLGRKVLCYFSAGSYEPGRPDSGDFKETDKGKEMDGWPGEYWLDLNSENVRNIMSRRVALAKEKGCDGVDPDNVDGYANDNGLSLTPSTSISFLSFLSNATLTHNLSMGLKNAGAIIPAVLAIVHFSVNEQCAQYDECPSFAPFITAHKPVFHIEYPDAGEKVTKAQVDKYCGDAEGAEGFSTVVKLMDLDGWVEYCDYDTFTTPVNTTG